MYQYVNEWIAKCITSSKNSHETTPKQLTDSVVDSNRRKGIRVLHLQMDWFLHAEMKYRDL